MGKQFIPAKQKYLLRWRFDFLNKPSVKGIWLSSHAPAWRVNKDGLIRAAVEGKDIRTRDVRTLAACDGHEFVNFKWHAIISHPVVGGSGDYPGVPIGLILQTRSQDVLTLIDGRHAIKDRTQLDKEFHYAGFGK